MNDVTGSPGYGAAGPLARHPEQPGDRSWGDRAVVGLAVVTAVGVRTGSPWSVVAATFGVVFLVRSGRRVLWVVVALFLGVVGIARSADGWRSLEPDRLGPVEGWVRVVDDPQPYPTSTRVILEVEGERFEMWSRGRAQQQRVVRWRGGEWLRVAGTRVALDGDRAGRVAWQHVVGRFELEWVGDVAAGSAVARASNRVRVAIERSAEFVPEPHGALFRGLVIGDDREQPRDMIDRFRASGLSHLTAVSGQNVAFVLAAFGPLLVRLRPWPR